MRKYAVEAKHIPPPRPHTAPPGAATFGMSAMAKPIRPEDLDRIDLLGGNGSWRQVLAEEEFERRRLADEETARQARTKVLEKKRKESEREAKLAAHARAEEKRFQADREQKRLNQLAAEQSQREAAESKRVQREFEMEERRRRMPKTCETCAGSAQCQECNGNGHIFHVFLRSKVSPEEDEAVGCTAMEHGRKFQGCEKCGGFAHNMLGDVKMGTGACAACNGHGKIWPIIDEKDPGTSPKSKGGVMQAWQVDRTGDVKM